MNFKWKAKVCLNAQERYATTRRSCFSRVDYRPLPLVQSPPSRAPSKAEPNMNYAIFCSTSSTKVGRTDRRNLMLAVVLTLSEGDLDDDFADVGFVVFAERDRNHLRPHPEGQRDGRSLILDSDPLAVADVDDSPSDLKGCG